MSNIIKKFMRDKLKEVEDLDFINLIDDLQGLEDVYSINYEIVNMYSTVGKFILKTSKYEYEILLQYKNTNLFEIGDIADEATLVGYKIA